RAIHAYLGDHWDMEHNRKIKPIVGMLLNHTNVKQVGQKPLVLQYMDTEETNSQLIHLSDVSDSSDVVNTLTKNQNPVQTEISCKQPPQIQANSTEPKTMSGKSDVSDTQKITSNESSSS